MLFLEDDKHGPCASTSSGNNVGRIERCMYRKENGGALVSFHFVKVVADGQRNMSRVWHIGSH